MSIGSGTGLSAGRYRALVNGTIDSALRKREDGIDWTGPVNIIWAEVSRLMYLWHRADRVGKRI